MALVIWIVFGVLIGWLATLVVGLDERFGCMFNIGLGVIGGVLGGLISTTIIEGAPNIVEFKPNIILWAFAGAILVVTVVTIIRRTMANRS